VSVTVIWSAVEPNNEDVLVKECVTILQGEWADCEGNAESAVQEICEAYFKGSEYDGLDDIDVTVTAPASIAGKYEVSLRRVVKASVTKK